MYSEIIIVINIIIIVIMKFSPIVEYIGKNITRNIGIEPIAAMKLEKQILLNLLFETITYVFWITPEIRMLVNKIFICSHILSLTGETTLVIKHGK